MVFGITDNKNYLFLGGIGVVVFLVGMLFGHLATPTTSSEDNQASKTKSRIEMIPLDKTDNQGYVNLVENKWEKEQMLNHKIIDSIDPNNIKNNLRYLSEKPHLASSPRDEELANHIRNKFEEAGFDSAELVPYNVLLSKPNPQNPNKITLLQNGVKIHESSHMEKPIHISDDDPNFIHAFNGFTPAGTVSTELGVGVVYVNYGRIEDFEKLEDLSINITGHMVLVRYGKIFRGNKVRHAEQFGAKGVIIFSDPEDVAPEGINVEDVYDNTFWLPGTGMQRGHTFTGSGDTLTPGWPSTEHAYRITKDEADLPNIPAQPIGYTDATEIMKRLGGPSAPTEWQGGLPGIDYKMGPFFNTENRDVSLSLSTHNTEKVEKSYNVIGIIKGDIEPDRYVLIGNHRDAWGYGASDPSSGTAQLLETVRVYGTLLKQGWRPRRSIVFCSWGAEEYGLIGSTEWVEEHVDKLQARAIAYQNTDICTSGSVLQIKASPLLQDIFLDITKMIPGVHDSTKTIFDEWKAYSEAINPEAPEHPVIKALGSGSDFAPFTYYAGVPAADVSYGIDKIKYNISIYPYYHTGYETFYMVSTFTDPGFKIHQGCSRIDSLVIKYLADSTIIPYSIHRLPKAMMTVLRTLKDKEKLKKIYDKYDELEKSIDRFRISVQTFETKIKNLDGSLSPLQIRAINDQMMKLEQLFIMPEGLPGRPTVRNVVFAPSQFNKYASSGFPALSDLLHKYDDLNSTQRMERDKLIKRHISDLTIMTDRAASYLKDDHII